MAILRALASQVAARPEDNPDVGTPVQPRVRVRPRPVLEARPRQGDLLTSLNRQDGRSDVERVGSEYVHLTNLIDFCARKHAIAGDAGVPTYKRITGGHKVMWEIGRAVEKNARNKLIRDWDYEGVWGLWTCVCEYEEFEGLYSLDFGPCPRCEHPRNVYKEWTFFDHENKITGNPDLLRIISGRFVCIEIKSMNGEDFNELEAPLPDHVFQAGGYRRLAMINGEPVHAEVWVLYVTKKFKWGSPYKEYLVPITEQHERVLDLAWADARVLADARAIGSLPPRICRAQGQTRAKNCAQMGECFMRSA